MTAPKSPKHRQKTLRDRQKAAGITRMTLSLSKATALLLRSLAVEHQVTKSQVLQMGVLLARKALLPGDAPQTPRASSPAPTDALAALFDQLDDLQADRDDLDDALPPMRASEARAINLGLVGAEARA